MCLYRLLGSCFRRCKIFVLVDCICNMILLSLLQTCVTRYICSSNMTLWVSRNQNVSMWHNAFVFLETLPSFIHSLFCLFRISNQKLVLWLAWARMDFKKQSETNNKLVRFRILQWTLLPTMLSLNNLLLPMIRGNNVLYVTELRLNRLNICII